MNWLKSYVANRKQVCNVGDVLTTVLNVTCGVPQGSILGPLLVFLFNVNDMLAAVTPKMMLNADDSS